MSIRSKFTLVLVILFAYVLNIGNASGASRVSSKSLNYELVTEKVLTIEGAVNEKSATEFIIKAATIHSMPGPVLIIIDSPGGLVDQGKLMLATIQAFKREGTVVVCAVRGEAVSMAFNILTHCDLRLALTESKFLAHQVFALMEVPAQDEHKVKLTIKGLTKLINRFAKMREGLIESDGPFTEANIKAMNVPRKEYMKRSDMDLYWTMEELLKSGYIHGAIDYVGPQ